MHLVLGNGDQSAHVRAELIFESREIDVAVTISVEHVLHEEGNVVLRGKDLVLEQVRLEVFVADKTVSVRVERPENFESSGLARAE